MVKETFSGIIEEMSNDVIGETSSGITWKTFKGLTGEMFGDIIGWWLGMLRYKGKERRNKEVRELGFLEVKWKREIC